jgi:hypothetical protein
MVVGKSRIWRDGLAVIVVMIIAVIIVRANILPTSSSAFSDIYEKEI